MKKTVLYIAAVLAVSGGLMWQRPMVAHAEPEVIQEAPVSTVLEVAAEEVADEDNGPAPEIQAARSWKKNWQQPRKRQPGQQKRQPVPARILWDYALQFVAARTAQAAMTRIPVLTVPALCAMSCSMAQASA